MSGKRLHPLHNVDFLAAVMRNTGCYPDTERCTGRTTWQALAYLSMAMQHPHKWVHPLDHHGSVESTRCLVRVAQDMVHKLGLKHFTFQADKLCFGSPV